MVHRRQFMVEAKQATQLGKIALVFPGQGSQFVGIVELISGMGSDIYKEFQSAKDVIDECEQVLGEPLKKIMFEGPQATLTQTANAQPAILCHSIALLRVMIQDFGFNVKKCTYALGHSLGEYALVATEALSLSDAIKLVSLRGKAMQSSVSQKETAMKALIVNNNNLENIERMMEKIQRSLPHGEVVQISNINSRTQIVLSGTSKGVEYAASIMHSKGLSGRSLPLPVSAPFHCSLMLPAADIMGPALHNIKFKKPIIDVISNVTAKPFQSTEEIPDMLTRQITETVQWHRSIQYAKEDFVFDWYPIGPSKVLANLLRKEVPHDVITNISTVDDLQGIKK